MKNILGKAVTAAMLALSVAGCASDESDIADLPPLPQEEGHNGIAQSAPQAPLQCVPYARAHSQVKLYGDAYTWWAQADGKFAKTSLPEAGSVLVLHDYAGPNHGHVAVVRAIVSPREIRIDHANWLDDGSVYLNDPVVDVSPDNDWSKVKVWNIKAGAWGSHIYPVQGFIGPGKDSGSLIARAFE